LSNQGISDSTSIDYVCYCNVKNVDLNKFLAESDIVSSFLKNSQGFQEFRLNQQIDKSSRWLITSRWSSSEGLDKALSHNNYQNFSERWNLSPGQRYVSVTYTQLKRGKSGGIIVVQNGVQKRSNLIRNLLASTNFIITIAWLIASIRSIRTGKKLSRHP
jgi:quinol monooxygenase YgiN